MIKVSSLCIAAACFALTSAACAQTAQTLYTVTPQLDGGDLTGLAVELRLSGDPDGETSIAFPDTWLGERGMFDGVSALSAEGAEVLGDGPNKRLRHAPSANLVVRYVIKATYDGEPGAGGGGAARPAVRPEQFSAAGHGLFAVLPERAGERVTVAWGPAPEGWVLASSLDGRGLLNRTQLLESISLGGRDLRVRTLSAGGGPLTVAFQGDWTMDEEEYLRFLPTLAETAAIYWDEPNSGYFLSFSPLQGGPGMRMGRGMDRAFSVWATPSTGAATLHPFTAHEYLHRFVPAAMGTFVPENIGGWFNEGVNEFVTLRLMLRSGSWTPQQFIDAWNSMLFNYATSPNREATNARIAERFYTAQDLRTLVYWRGAMLAAIWDARLREATNGRADIDDVLLATKRRASRGTDTSIENFLASWETLGGNSLQGDLAEHVEAGRGLLVPDDLFGACATITTTLIKTYDRGYDLADGVIVKVRPDSGAWTAGLRDGMRQVAVTAGQANDSRVERAVRVSDAGGEREIRYLPAGETEVPLQQATLRPGMNAEQTAECAVVLSGQ